MVTSQISAFASLFSLPDDRPLLRSLACTFHVIVEYPGVCLTEAERLVRDVAQSRNISHKQYLITRALEKAFPGSLGLNTAVWCLLPSYSKHPLLLLKA